MSQSTLLELRDELNATFPVALAGTTTTPVSASDAALIAAEHAYAASYAALAPFYDPTSAANAALTAAEMAAAKAAPQGGTPLAANAAFAAQKAFKPTVTYTPAQIAANIAAHAIAQQNGQPAPAPVGTPVVP